MNEPTMPMGAPAPMGKPESSFESIEKLLMVFVIILTICMFSYWGYQAVMYILSVAYSVTGSGFTLYDMFIGFIAMIASVLLFVASLMWWRKVVAADMFFRFGAAFFIVKDLLEIPNALTPLNQLAIVRSQDLIPVASAIGYDLFKIGFWIFVMMLFMYSIKKYKQTMMGGYR